MMRRVPKDAGPAAGSGPDNRASEELGAERNEFSHRLASFGLGEVPEQLLEETQRPLRKPGARPAKR